MRTTRRRRYAVVGLIVVLALVVGSTVSYRLLQRRFVPLYAEGVAVGADGVVRDVQAGEPLVPGFRVFADSPSAVAQTRAQREWLAAGTMPATPPGTSSDLISNSLLDLHVLTGSDGVTVAGWTPLWRYVWPRDSAYVLSAFARTGHVTEAERLLAFLEQVQQPDGRFQARYTTSGAVPDDRGEQLDGTGWALWGLAEVVRQLPAADAADLVRQRQGLLDRSSSAIEALIDNESGLPPASADYWEVRERRVTLATCAVLLAGLRSAAYAYGLVGQPDRAAVLTGKADRFEATIEADFGPDGYPRRLDGRASSVDLGVALLLPPFAGTNSVAARQTFQEAPRYLSRPAGGLAPGGSWRRDGISWTPTTTSWAMTAACVDPAQAVARLQWVDRHRTATGAIPEKVLDDGSPAAVAPLALSAAAVIIAADLLDRGCPTGGAPESAAGPRG